MIVAIRYILWSLWLIVVGIKLVLALLPGNKLPGKCPNPCRG